MRVVVTGSGGFIGHHLCKFLKETGVYVVGIDVKKPEFEETSCHEFHIKDLRYPSQELFENTTQVYHLAANMGGIGYIENNKADIVFDNTLINTMTLCACKKTGVKKFLFSSSACVYPKYLQDKQEVIKLKEDQAYPADAEDGYGWEKLMMERMCRHAREDWGMKTYIARFHNIYGPLGTYQGGKEKSPAALCRKISIAKQDDEIEIWGDGEQVRSYCYVDDCVQALYKLMNSNYHDPLNIGTEEEVTINSLSNKIERISGKHIWRKYDLTKPLGVKSRNADISKAKEILQWQPIVPLNEGLEKTYKWIHSRIYPS
jgi:GDP-D-mannose 3',5'-epimerase